MKKFIGEIKVEDPGLMNDIVHALEFCPPSGREYEIEMFEHNPNFDPCDRPKRPADDYFTLKIFVKETL